MRSCSEVCFATHYLERNYLSNEKMALKSKIFQPKRCQTLPALPNVRNLMLCTTKYKLRAPIITAMRIAAYLETKQLTKLPIFARELVKWTKGTTAKMRVKERMTWLRTSRRPAPALPPIAATMAAGMMAMERVMRRRSQGFSLI